MTNEQIKRMVDRFLTWKLPADFAPDGGVGFAKRPMHEPVGTNLFTATQAEAMVRHMVGELTVDPCDNLAAAAPDLLAALIECRRRMQNDWHNKPRIGMERECALADAAIAKALAVKP